MTIFTAKTFYGTEPEFKKSTITEANYQSELLLALNWYSTNSGKNHRAWTQAWMKREGYPIEGISGVPNDRLSTLGKMSRLALRGFPFNNAEETKMFEILFMLEATYVKEKPVVTKIDEEMKALKKIDAEDTLVGTVFNSFDQYIDQQLKSDKQLKAPTVDCSRINVSQMTEVRESYEKQLSELREAYNQGDEEIVEAYDVYGGKTKNNKYQRQLIKLFEGIIEELTKQEFMKAAQKPFKKKRKVKIKTPEQMTSKVKYLKESKDPKLKSIDVEKLIGASAVYVFNTKDRKLHYYFAPAGIEVKGSTMKNFDTTRSYAKKIRKPDEFLKTLLKAPKVRSVKQIESVKAVESKVTGRINGHCIILKVYS